MAEIKVLKSKKVEEEEVFVNPDYPDLINQLDEWIKLVGCSELHIVVTSGCMTYSEVFDTHERTEAGLGALERYKARYARELDEDEE